MVIFCFEKLRRQRIYKAIAIKFIFYGNFLHTYMLVDLKWVSWIRLNSLGRKLLLVVKQK